MPRGTNSNHWWLQTHSYDGKLGVFTDVSPLKEEIKSASDVPREEKLKKFRDLVNELKDKINFGSLHCLSTIIRDFELRGKDKTSNGNWDPANNLFADDLLWLCCQNKDAVQLLEIQLEDMVTGMCPQGRTTRLLQTYIMCKAT